MENGLITMITGSRVDAHEHKNTHKKGYGQGNPSNIFTRKISFVDK
jgi:hypothetical protein